MMKILYITLENLSLHKGSVVHVKEIVNGLRERGYHVGLVASSLNKDEKAVLFYNLNIIPSYILQLLRLKKQPYIASLVFLFLYLWRILPQYDIIYARDYHTVIAALFPRLLFRKKLVYEINGIAHEEQKLKSHSILNHILVSFIRKAEKMATKYSERIISVTLHIGTYLIENYKCAPDKVIIIGNGVNTKKFYPIRDEALLEQWRNKVGITKEEIIIAFVGNLAPWQGVETLIEVAPLILKEVRNIKFLIIGDGILRKEFKAKVNRLGVSDHFIFTGMIQYENIPILINLADICVAPFISRRNRTTGVSPLKVFEYMACGKPIVCSRIEGLEFIEQKGVGRLISPEDVMSLQGGLIDLIKNPQKRIMMGNKGLQISREIFNWESRVIEIEKVLIELA
jgi:glycosyltransferase involved in cell wall biosynthesis